MNRINRLFRIVNLMISIRNQPGVQVEQLSSRFNVSQRTIYRDISILIAIGVPIVQDGGYRLAPGLFIPPISFTVNEANVLKDACYQVLEQKHSDETLLGILEKLNSAMYLQNSPLYAQNRDLFSSLKEYFESGTLERVNEQHTIDTVEKIRTGISDSVYLEVTCTNTVTNERTSKVVQPVGLVFQKSGWLLLIKEKGRDSVTSMPVRSIDQVTVTNAKYALPGNATLEFVFERH